MPQIGAGQRNITDIVTDCWVDNLLDLDFDLNEFCGKTDEELAAMAKTDVKAANAILLRYSRLIIIKSAIYAGRGADSEDLQQEGLIGLYIAANAYCPEKNVKFSTFAETCIVRRMLSYLRKTGKYPVCEALDEQPELSSDVCDPEKILLGKEYFSELWQAVNTRLSDTEREVFSQVVAGNSYKETAKKLGLTEKAVDNAMQRARRKIRAYISDQTD